ncbi:MAG: thiopurine S-methyltransferase [Gammaproteobacteria bacterium]
MEPDFWLDKWASAQIGFHEPHAHPLLVAHWEALDLAPCARVFVPLCGKSLDMCWLAQAGCTIVGIEIAGVAVGDFFAERGLTAERSERGALVRHEAGAWTLYHGDFFALAPTELGAVDAVYDRAALIALTPAQRRAYAHHLTALVTPGTRMLLITLEYDESLLRPPPFVVMPDEVEALFGSDWRVEQLAVTDAEAKGQPARETVFRLDRR